MAFVGCTRPPIYSTKYNLDFEYAKNDSEPTQWMLGNSSTTGYHISLDKQIKHHETTSIRIQWEQPTQYNSLGGFRHIFPKTLAAGKELEVSGWIKTRDIEQDGFAGFHLFEKNRDGKFREHLDTIQAVRKTSDWTHISTKTKIGNDAEYIALSGILKGKGTAWFDNIELRIDGRKYEDKAIPAPKTELSDREKKELRRYVYPLRTCEPDDEDTQDLDILRQLVGECRAVGLGENTHGTSEVFKMKDRIIRYLAENCGFDIFALEANMPECYQLNNYTVGGIDNPIRLLIGIYMWPWRTHEMLNMIEWMKVFNASEPRITFTGVDMQVYTAPLRLLQRTFTKDESEKYLVSEIARNLRHIYTEDYQFDTELAKKADADLTVLELRLKQKKLTPMQHAWAQRNIELLHQFLSQGEDLDWRDKGMANNLLWIIQQNPDARIAIWAHNAHISRSQSRTSSSRPMGAFLKDSLADDFRSFGFVCFEGEFTAKKGPQYFPAILKPEPGTLEYLLEQLNEPQFILNLKKMREEKAHALQWIDKQVFRAIGANPDVVYDTRVSDMFDYLIFIRNTSASHMIQ
ncbi:erythromycin esterase family protein [uncultured Alistipes sp.]|uniref:erythromycin esterase family protein n=2 Tax=Alistipes TaxID=239759 RepID=UPI0026652372|nr:erythromycin esterase family protein [uncultured Alistipes sp.]